MLSKWFPDLSIPIYYIAGPSAMVTGVRGMLTGAGVAEAGIRAEQFYGYQ
jgi:ferredoxin-NADP reductase